MKQGPPDAGRVMSLLAAFVATSIVGGILLAGLGMPAVGATGFAARNSVEFFEELPSELATPPLSQKSTLLAADGAVIAEFYEENRINVRLDQIAPVMQQAIVAIEDSRFYQHGGVDPKGLFRAAATNYFSNRIMQGASTLTQQYVKNVQIETAYVKGDTAGVEAATADTKKRKIQEIKLAISLEKKLSKQEILNRYLNISYFGDKVYGVEAAARYFFNTTATKLTLPQAALLAGLVQLPGEWSPRTNPEGAVKRRNVVLGRMLQLKMIDQAAHDAAKATPLAVTLTKAKNGCANAGARGFYCDYIQRLIVNDPAFSSLGKTEEERRQSLLRGGLSIQTTMDRTIQDAAWRATTSTIPPTDKSGVATAAVTVEPGTGKLLAIAQNREYDPGGDPGKVATNYATDYEFGGSQGFQTGSTFKPFTLATWLKAGKSLNAVVSAEGGPAPRGDFKSCGKRLRGTEPYSYGNAEGDGSGSMGVLEGTYKSVNTVYVSMEKQLDLCDIAETAKSLGVHLAYPQQRECYDQKPLPGQKVTNEDERPYTTDLPGCIPSLTLGPKELSPMTMAAAFAAFATGGTFCTPIAVLSIKDRDGKPLAVPQSKCTKALDKEVAAGVNYALSKVLTQGTAASVGGIGRPAAGKTGTTNDSVDTWFVGYTAQRATAVWVGDPIPKPKSSGSKELVRKTLNGRTIAGDRRGRVYGSTFAAPIWKKIMTKAHNGLPKVGFATPPGKMLVQDKVPVPDVAGQPVGAAMDLLRAQGFNPTVNPQPEPSQFPAGSVAKTSPAGGSRAGRGAAVVITVSAGGGVGGGDDGFTLFPGFDD